MGVQKTNVFLFVGKGAFFLEDLKSYIIKHNIGDLATILESLEEKDQYRSPDDRVRIFRMK